MGVFERNSRVQRLLSPPTFSGDRVRRKWSFFCCLYKRGSAAKSAIREVPPVVARPRGRPHPLARSPLVGWLLRTGPWACSSRVVTIRGRHAHEARACSSRMVTIRHEHGRGTGACWDGVVTIRDEHAHVPSVFLAPRARRKLQISWMFSQKGIGGEKCHS